MALTRLFVHDTFYDATDNFTYTPGMRLTLDNTTQSARITRLQNSGVVSTDETIDPSGVAITGGNIDGTVIGATTAAAGTFTTITVDTTTLVTDAANNRVGIGTAGPVYNLHVRDATARVAVHADSPTNPLLIEQNSSGDGSVLLSSAGTLSIGVINDSVSDRVELITRNVTRAVIDDAGNVGIGTTSPDNKLHVSGTSNLVAKFGNTTASGNARVIFQTPSYQWNIGINNSGGAFTLYDGTNNIVQVLSGAPANSFYVNSSGNVGIGTTNPSQKLEVSGGNFRITASTTGTPISLLANATTGELARIYATNSSTFYLQTTASGDIVFQSVNNGEIIRMKGSSGNVGIGTTSPSYKIDVESAGGFAARFKSTVTSSATDVLIVDQDNSTGRYALDIQGNAGAVSIAQFHSNGRVTLASLPTSATGLSAGDLWNNSGVINIV